MFTLSYLYLDLNPKYNINFNRSFQLVQDFSFLFHVQLDFPNQ